MRDTLALADDNHFYIETKKMKHFIYEIYESLGSGLFFTQVADNISPLTFGNYSLVLWTSPTVREMLENLCEYSIFLGSTTRMKLIENSQGDLEILFITNETLNIQPLTYLGQAYFVSLIIKLLLKLCPQMANTIKLKVHDFPFDNKQVFNFEKQLNCVLSLNSPIMKIIISQHFLNFPIATSDPDIYPSLVLILKNWVVKIQSEDILLRIYDVFEQFPRLSDASNQKVADGLMMSVRTLNRRLSEINTSYRNVVEKYKLEKALFLLKQQRVNMTEIAFQLGFADLSSFSRAFKRWTGLSPSNVHSKQRKPLA
ncbi:AraC-type DNA-binding domain-containing protein [Shewanella violacea DSS12]|uniref:AraC-type DNA-binding domain-containing protein n=2 Tax=Shewanella violacea TaxID=60217 RepID=D4ZHV7_SHEVD|nr:AraC-type DNA-binding domain-containing protein [Shewanella violacea DSS12]